MYYYQKEIKAGNLKIVEIYPSIRKRSLKNIGRSQNYKLSSEKQRIANDLRAIRRTQRLILNNFESGKDLYLTLKFYEDQTEESATKALDNFLRRLKYYRKKNGLVALKYIGCIECGKRGNRWHIHIVINEIDIKVITKLWKMGPVHFEILYDDGNYEALARYILKDTGGEKRLRRSRNLVPPKETVKELPKRRLKEFLTGAVPKPPKGYYLQSADYTVNDYTGTAAVYIFLPAVFAVGTNKTK